MDRQGDSIDPLLTAQRWKEEGRDVAIATVIETWGSAPRPVGSHLVIDGEGNFQGSVSGGCVEGWVVTEALDIMGRGEARVLEFGVADETAWQVGLSCGGTIRIYVERLGQGVNLGLLQELNAERAARKAAALMTDLDDGTSRLFRHGKPLDGKLGEAVAGAFRTGKSGMHEIEGRPSFINIHVPPARLVIVGAVHISQALAPMAQLAGFDVRIVDPRTAFATAERFRDIDLDPDWPDEAFSRRPLDAYTGLAVLTHDPKIDDRALIAALDAGCFYVGALGSRKTHAKRLDRLLEAGVEREALARIAAPIGLDIGAHSPAEIAVAILAEFIAARGDNAEPAP